MRSRHRLSALACALVAVFALFQNITAAAGDDSWEGVYRYAEIVATVPGPATIDHEIEITRQGAVLSATLHSEGFQTDETLVCHGVVNGGRLDLVFDSYDGGATVNKYGVAVYKKGDLLLTLKRDAAGKKGRILTLWDRFRPNDPKAKSGKTYFERE